MRRILIRIAVLLVALATEPVLAHHSALHFAGSAAELLEPEKAFAMSARVPDARTAEVSFAIADGYYMYRERFKFALEEGAQLKLGAPPRFSTSASDVDIAAMFQSGSQWLVLASFLGFGLLLAFTTRVPIAF